MNPPGQALQVLCGSESRRRLFEALYRAPATGLHLRALAAAAGVDPGHVHKLLPALIEAGLCEQVAAARPRYRASPSHPLFARLQALFGEAGEPEEVDLRAAPVLRSLLWTGKERARIPAPEAFRHYERNWRFVRRGPIGPGERRLIERLARRYGAGLING